MFRTSIEPRACAASSAFHLLEFVGRPLPFPPALDLCREQAPMAGACEGLRFAAAAKASTCRHAFRPAFATGDWRVFASYCIVRRLPPSHRVTIPGPSDRTLRFLVEGSLRRQSGFASEVLRPGAILGEDALFSDGPCALDVRTLEASVILELSLPRQKELTASCPEIAFELLRAAGAVIAAGGRSAELPGQPAAS